MTVLFLRISSIQKDNKDVRLQQQKPDFKVLPVFVEENTGDGGSWEFRRGIERRWRILEMRGNGSLHETRQPVVCQRTATSLLPSIIYTPGKRYESVTMETHLQCYLNICFSRVNDLASSQCLSLWVGGVQIRFLLFLSDVLRLLHTLLVKWLPPSSKLGGKKNHWLRKYDQFSQQKTR